MKRRISSILLPIEIVVLGVFFMMAVDVNAQTVEEEHFTMQKSPATVDADGYTTITLTSPVLEIDGSTLPNGTEFTVTAGSGAVADDPSVQPAFVSVESTDVNPEQAGVQVASTDGVVTVVVRAGYYSGAAPVSIISELVDDHRLRSEFSIALKRHTPLTLTSLVLNPETPTATDTATVVLRGSTPTPSWDVSFSEPVLYESNGRNIIQVNIHAVRTVDPSDFVVQQLDNHAASLQLPSLEDSKIYTIRVNENGTLIQEHVFDTYSGDEPYVFSDITPSYWAYDYIMSLWSDSILSGYEDQTFRPENSIARAELLKIVARSADITIESELEENPFADVSLDAWYADYVLSAYKLGIISGYEKNGELLFSPDAPITRADMLKILFRSFQIPTVRIRETSFDDVAPAQLEYVETAVAYDLAHGYGDQIFGPNRPITRAEASKIVERTRRLDADSRLEESSQISETGKASYYSDEFEGRSTASGELYDPAALTAAHRNLTFGTVVEVTNLANDRSVQVTINDRGPFIEGRILDLSGAAFDAIAERSTGVIDVQYEVVSSN